MLGKARTMKVEVFGMCGNRRRAVLSTIDLWDGQQQQRVSRSEGEGGVWRLCLRFLGWASG